MRDWVRSGVATCDGKLEVFIADESSWRCTRCDWSGWPRQDVEPGTGRILKQYPHEYVRQTRLPE